MSSSHTESTSECVHDWQSGGKVPGIPLMLPDVCMRCGALQEYLGDGAVVITTFPEAKTDEDVAK